MASSSASSQRARVSLCDIVHAIEHASSDVAEVMLVAASRAELDEVLTAIAERGDLRLCRRAVELGGTRLDEALCVAAAAGHLSVCEYLLGCGAQATDEAIMQAVLHDHLAVAHMLQERQDEVQEALLLL